MQKINWDKFKVKNENYTRAFEELSYFLFCRKYKRNAGIFSYENQIGIETEPIQEKRSLIGFQSKWFESKINKESITTAITKAKEKNPKLNKIIFYINQKFTESPKKGVKDSQLKIDIEDHARQEKVVIEWIVPSNFEQILNQPSNYDLAQLYFDHSDEFGFIKAFSNPEILTFLQSSEYIELPFFNTRTEKTEDITKKILELKRKTFLISGHPGAGKSISIYRIFQIFSGLDKPTLEDSRQVLQKNCAIPMLINLKNCAFETIESIIRDRQNDYKLRNNNLGFIYLLDGLDELSVEKADHVLSYIYELEKNENTKKIVISCRSGNLNKIKVKTYFKDIIEYKIHNLTKNHISKYFSGKNDLNKGKLLQRLVNKNPNIFLDIKDILLIKLLWDTIENLNEASTIIDLLDKKVELLVKDPQYKKNIDDLNLLNPKENKILELNREISYKFQKRFQFRLSQKEIQDIILTKYPRLDYTATNEILNYIANLFFDGFTPDSPEDPDSSTFVYQHRRYQDYFFIQHLAKVYERNPKVLRELNILSNRDFFENLFLSYLREKYKKDRNLPGIIELNLIDVYLGNRNDYGADDPYYQNSSAFIPALAIQDNIVVQELLSDESLVLKDKISLDLREVHNKFIKWEKNKENYRLKDYLQSVWNGGLSFLVQNTAAFWSYGKKDIAGELRKITLEIMDLFEKYKFEKNLKENEKLNNPFWVNWEDYLYLQLEYKKLSPSQIFTKLVKDNYKAFEGEDVSFGSSESGKEKLIKSFFRALIKSNKGYLPEIISVLEPQELLMLLDVLVSKNNLPLLLRNSSVRNKIKLKITDINQNNIQLLFCKKLFNVPITQEQNKFLEMSLNQLREKRAIDWHMRNSQMEYSLVTYILGDISFEKYLKPQQGHPFKYYDELGLYAALFKDYIELLENKKTLESIARDYIRYINFYIEGTYGGKYLKIDMSFLWAYIFAYSKTELQKLRNIKNSLIIEENNLVPFSFYYKLQKIDKQLFAKIINKSELRIFENHLKNWEDDAPSFVNRCFVLSSFFAGIDKQKAIFYLAKGINEGMVRHGWHKDIIVSHFLIEALEILWRNNWASKEELRILSKKVYDLCKEVRRITDGDHTSRGPYSLIDMVAKFDIDYAIALKSDLIKTYGGKYTANATLTSILQAKISHGVPYEELEQEIKAYRKEYRYDGKPDESYYEKKFEIYLSISESDFYSPDERRKAFESAYQQVEDMKKEGLDYYLSDMDFKDLKRGYVNLCKKYGKKINVTFEKKKEYYREFKVTESEFIKELKKAKTKQKMVVLYKKINNDVELKKPESWKMLIDKTYYIYKNVHPFIDLLRENSFPHTDWFRANSQNFKYGLGVILDNLDTREEALNYLFDKTTGHGGFVNVMKSYETIGDREMCIKLFRRYLRFCDFLVN